MYYKKIKKIDEKNALTMVLLKHWKPALAHACLF
jgi:hypothetical protein